MRSSYSYALTLIGSFTLVITLFFYGLQNALPVNPLENMKISAVFKAFPQGWGFFSKNPRDEVIVMLDSTYRLAPNWPNNTWSNALGLKRYGRTQGIELGLLYSNVPEGLWEVCETDLATCTKNADVHLTIQNTTPNPAFCGEFTLAMREVVPWAWADILTPEEMPSRYVKVVSSCSIN
ncbi:SdpA family antimicrobial peptide system protein [Paenibacillus sp. NPDC057967]|uniref:SdpA family antimicrobial peptide system protein n=1 Tax=Paenibacillus sp. NPDC057967 TaxID=3346293 RepID=UPI0036DE1A7F